MERERERETEMDRLSAEAASSRWPVPMTTISCMRSPWGSCQRVSLRSLGGTTYLTLLV